MQKIQGDLLALGASGRFDVIVHGCNCMNTMGKGIAASIRQQFPDAYEVDRNTKKGSKDKLGTYTSASIDCEDGHELTVVNAYTQFHYGAKYKREGRNADYDAIRNVFRLIQQDFSGKRIGYPLIGAGLAGGDWNIISDIIDEELRGEDHTLVIFEPNGT